MACAVSGPRSRVRDIFGAGNHHSAILNGSADVYTGKASEFVDKIEDKTNKNPGRDGPGLLINGDQANG